ncbi:FkbM family methyltransferase [Wenzhouxiangella marina]|uniref:Uncharacterized protein n=1 Tax=Wenzhouxiangella marina TaxID=1579979 RepID=A0A0K0XYQ7_9GAMM|nr:FkbM family methyltransferase [Wenzhouxiangella marina]AKS42757.1 hypothetical protein WM2015_2395 [Wenzhouxiangella marina]MBB6087567.1 FkbM family methyltransferase [Wenzhouxiangella marina]
MLKHLARAIYASIPFKPAAMHALRRVWRPPERIYRHFHFCGPFSLDMPNGASLQLQHFGNQVENDLFWAGFGAGWERTSLLTWLWLIRDATTIIDIGANTGVYALSAQAARPESVVIAVEPLSRVYKRLLHNISLNGFRTRAFNVALSNHSCNVLLFDPGGSHAYSASLNPKMLGADMEAVSVQALRLDDLLETENVGSVQVMKIDVEMHEPEVIEGASRCIERDQPAMLIEILNETIGMRLAAALPGYVFYQIDERLEMTDKPGNLAGRNYLLLPQHDLRVNELGEIADIRSLCDWS